MQQDTFILSTKKDSDEKRKLKNINRLTSLPEST